MKKGITDVLFAQIMDIRDSGVVNLFDVRGVQREAHNRNFYELVIYLEEHRKEFATFLLTGDRGGDEAE